MLLQEVVYKSDFDLDLNRLQLVGLSLVLPTCHMQQADEEEEALCVHVSGEFIVALTCKFVGHVYLRMKSRVCGQLICSL